MGTARFTGCDWSVPEQDSKSTLQLRVHLKRGGAGTSITSIYRLYVFRYATALERGKGADFPIQLKSCEGGGEGGPVLGGEKAGSGDEGVGAAGAGARRVLLLDAAVDLDAQVKVTLASPAVDLAHLGQHVLAEGLASEARLD